MSTTAVLPSPTLSGTITPDRVAAPVVSGTVTPERVPTIALSGTAALRAIPSGSYSGTATIAAIKVPSGSLAALRSKFFSPPGAVSLHGFFWEASGGIKFGGGAIIVGDPYLAAGGILFGGAATVQFLSPTTITNDDTSGGIAFGGSAIVQEAINYVASGGLRFGGGDVIPFAMEGGIAFGGSAVVQEVIPFKPTGGVLFGGAADVSTVSTHVASGGMLFGGAADMQFVLPVHITNDGGPTSGLLFGGSADVHSTSSHVADGGLAFGGSADFRSYSPFHLPTGGMRFGGHATAFVLPAGAVLTPENPDNDEFLGWAVNLETGAPSLYLSMPANSFCRFKGKTYAANAAGIYELGANDDAGQPIHAAVMPPTSDYGTEKEKVISAATVAARIGTKLRLAVATDKGEYRYYSINRTAWDGKVAANRVKLGQGLKGRFWSWRIENVDGGDFDLESLSFTPTVLSRRGRGR
jgi:hypothetical protein